MPPIDRRRFLGRMAMASAAVALGGCEKLADSKAMKSLLAAADRPTDAALHALTSETALAQEFTEADISPVFKANGSVNPTTPEYLAMPTWIERAGSTMPCLAAWKNIVPWSMRPSSSAQVSECASKWMSASVPCLACKACRIG